MEIAKEEWNQREWILAENLELKDEVVELEAEVKEMDVTIKSLRIFTVVLLGIVLALIVINCNALSVLVDKDVQIMKLQEMLDAATRPLIFK